MKLMARYGFNRGDFWFTEGNLLVLKDGVPMPDSPPVCELSDSILAARRNAAKLALTSDQSVLLRATIVMLIDQINSLRASVPHPLLSLTRNGSTVTATTPVAHGLLIGSNVSIFGADQNGYSGTVEITGVPTANTFTYVIPGTPATPATGSLLYVEGPIPPPTPQVTVKQVINAIQNKIDSGAGD